MVFGGRSGCAYNSFFYMVLSLSFLFISCDNPTKEQEEPDIQILVPELGREYNSYDTNYIVIKFNKNNASIPNLNFSIDSGNNWKKMTLIRNGNSSMRGEDDFSYDVHRWLPETDSVKSIKILIKASSYDSDDVFVIKGPITIN